MSISKMDLSRVPRRKPMSISTTPGQQEEDLASSQTSSTIPLRTIRHYHAPSSVTPSVTSRESHQVYERASSPSEPEDEESEERQPSRGDVYKRIDTSEQSEDAQKTLLQRRGHFNLSTIAADCGCILLPLLLLGFVVSLWHLHDQPYIEGSLDVWQDGIKIMATAFPILFASVIGRLLSSLCRWRLEKGTNIGFLETLMGSRTVGSTLTTLFQLRFATLATFVLVAVWSISPLGAQAFLRMLSIETRVDNMPIQLAYSGWNASARFTIFSEVEYYKLYGPVIETIYSAVLISASTFRTSPVDVWGNIRIPALNYEEGGSDGDEWRSVHQEAEYVSLLGVPVNNSIPVGNTSFSITSTHVDLKCAPLNVTRGFDLDHDTARNISDFAKLDIFDRDFSLPPNGTWSGPCGANSCADTSWSLAINRYIDQYWHEIAMFPPNMNQISPALFGNEEVLNQSTKLLFQAYISSDIKFLDFSRYYTVCNVRQLYVESRINCTKTGALDQPICAADRQRLSQQSHPSSNISFLSFPVAFARIAENLPTKESTGISDLSVQYLHDPSGLRVMFGQTLNITAEDFSLRLSQLVNTYIFAHQHILQATSGFTIHSTLPGQDVAIGLNEWLEEYIRVSKTWNLICAASCLVLLICGAAGVVIGHIAKGPDMLGCVTSSIRDSRYINIPASYTTLDSMELAREMKARQIRAGVLGRAQGEEAHGAIVYGIAENRRYESK